MDIFEASDYETLLPRRVREAVGWALLIGVAWLPPVRTWYVGQVQHHAEHVVHEFKSRVFPDVGADVSSHDEFHLEVT